MNFKLSPLLVYILKFAAIFCVCYFGTLAIIGLATKGGYYSSFIDKNLDYVSWLKTSLINGTAFILSLSNIATKEFPGFMLRIAGGRAIVISMSCVGYGVYSFWIAFVGANHGTASKKAFWIVGGLVILWFINVVRITLVLLGINRGWPMPLGLDHHTWFTIAAYIAIFILIGFYDNSSKNKILRRKEKKPKLHANKA